MKNLHQVRILVAVLACLAAGVRAQDAGRQPELSIDSVQERIAGLEPAEQEGTLDEDGKTRLQLYRQAVESLRAAGTSDNERTRFADDFAAVPGELQKIRAELARPPDALKPDLTAGAGLTRFDQALKQAVADLDAARQELSGLADEPQRRATRFDEIREQIATAQQQLDEANTQITALPVQDESPSLTDARRTRLRATRLALEQRIAFLVQERGNYEARNDLLPLRHELAARRVAQIELLVADWQAIVDEQRADDIQRQQHDAKQAVARANPVVAPIARDNVELARERGGAAAQDRSRKTG